MDFLASAAKACAVMALVAVTQLGNVAQACGCVLHYRQLPIEASETRLRAALRPEIDSGVATIIGSEPAVTLRISEAGMFAPGATTLAPRHQDLMRRIGEALRGAPGPVRVIGHADRGAIRTVRFQPSRALATARADAVIQAIAPFAGDTSRFTAEGRADDEQHIDVVLPRGMN